MSEDNMEEREARKYRTIVADPPWRYAEGWPGASTSAESNMNRGEVPDEAKKRKPLPYEAMSVEEIAGLPVSEIALPDAHLFLWTTNRYLMDAYLAVIPAWGFRVSQLLTWCKPPRGIGPGGLFASASEFIVYARRGKPEHLQRQDSTWWEWKRAVNGEHSAKPDAFLDLVEQTVPGPYVELFARRARFGWDYWGNESLGTAEMAA
jgi:N6-adenosine-specific RNA methylase IME4